MSDLIAGLPVSRRIALTVLWLICHTGVCLFARSSAYRRKTDPILKICMALLLSRGMAMLFLPAVRALSFLPEVVPPAYSTPAAILTDGLGLLLGPGLAVSLCRRLVPRSRGGFLAFCASSVLTLVRTALRLYTAYTSEQKLTSLILLFAFLTAAGGFLSGIGSVRRQTPKAVAIDRTPVIK